MPYNPKSKLNLKPFVKGDPRINRAGVPADAIAARRFVQELGAEIIKTGDGDMTRYYAMLRLMFNSKQPKDREILLKMMGHLRDELDVQQSGETKVVIEYADHNSNTPPLTRGADPDQAGTEEA